MRDLRCLIALLFVSGSLANWLPGQSARIENLGWLDVTSPVAYALSVSGDGRMATGLMQVPGGTTLALWTPVGMRDYGNPTPAVDIVGNALSADGSVIVGAMGIPEYRAFRRTNTGFYELGTISGTPGSISFAYGCSADGEVVVGKADVSPTRLHAFAYQYDAMLQANFMHDLGTIANADGDSEAKGCSTDGSVIAGYSFNGSRIHACRFAPGQAPVDLGTIENTVGDSYANAVSANGLFIVGNAAAPGGVSHAFDLSDAYGFFDLGTVDGAAGNSVAYSVSANGLVSVGFSINDNRPGGQAAVWNNGLPRQLWDLLENDYGLDLAGWTSLEVVYDVSDDGNTFVGVGKGFGSDYVPFRVTLTPNRAPIVIIQSQDIVAECTGDLTDVAFPIFVYDPDGDSLDVQVFVNGVLASSLSDVPSGATGFVPGSFPDGEFEVKIEVSDGQASAEDAVTVTIADTTSPIVIAAAGIVKRVNPGEVFATMTLTPPSVTDVCDPNPAVTSNAPAKFPIGVTNVLWTVKDKDNNVATATQKVTVTNAPPVANAGVDIVKKTTGATAVATLNGAKSSDPDQHTLRYSWTAVPGVKFSGKTTSKPTGTFKVGTTKVTLTVVDEAGVKATDMMNVKVQKVRKARKRGANADSAVRESYAAGAKANGKGKASAASAVGLASSAQAYALGALAGDDLGTKAAPAAGDVGAYVSLRRQQAAASQRAARSFWDAYFLRGHDDALEASLYAHAAGAHALGDATASEYTERLTVSVE